MDGLWAITDIIKRTHHKPTVRRLVVPGHNFDEQHKREDERRRRKEIEQMMMTMDLNSHFTTQQLLPWSEPKHRRRFSHFFM